MGQHGASEESCLPQGRCAAGLRTCSAVLGARYPSLWSMDPSPGSFATELAQLGLPAVGAEVTGCGGCLDADVDAYRDAVLNALRLLGMPGDEQPPYCDAPARRYYEVTGRSRG